MQTTPPTAAPAPTRFDDLPLSAEAREGLKALGYELATPVQAATFAPAMEGRDLLVQSKTGTGKTTAFGLPLVERIRLGEGLNDPQALVLCPTRELAIQVSEEIAELSDPKGVRVLPVYGGQPMGPQLASLRSGCDVIVGTPGRVLDHIRRRTLRLVHVHIAVLDEADEMLSMGFWDEVTAILDQLPEKRQTFLFSATLPDAIRKAAAKYMKDPQSIDISRDELTVEGIKNIVYERDDRLPKPRNLLYVLEVERPESAIIFCNTRDDASVVAAFLRRQGLHALALSGDLNQKERERIMNQMKRGELQFLVATDIAARGIDISDLSHVILYSLPEFTEVYLHRVGRTGRIGKTGTAISLVGGRDEMTQTLLERDYGIVFEKRTLPPAPELARLHAERVAGELLKEAREVELTSFLPLAERLRTVDGGAEVVAYLLKRYFSQVELERERAARDEEGRRRVEDERKSRPAPAAAAPVERERRGRRGRGRGERIEEPRSQQPPQQETAAPAAPQLSERPSEAGPTPDRVRLFVNRGSNDSYDEEKLRALIIEIAGAGDPTFVGRVQLRRTHAFVEVPEAIAIAVLAASERGVEKDEKALTVERARTR